MLRTLERPWWRCLELNGLEGMWALTWSYERVCHAPVPAEVEAGFAMPSDHGALRAARSATVQALATTARARRAWLTGGADLAIARHVATQGVLAAQAQRTALESVDAAMKARAAAFHEHLEATAYQGLAAADVDGTYRAAERALSSLRAASEQVLAALDRARPRPDWLRDNSVAEASSRWRQAETAAAEHMRALGFHDAAVSPDGVDAGFDVEARRAVAQVKYWAHPVGRPQVQNLVGANQHDAVMLFYARSGFTTAAARFADQVGVALFVIELPDRVEPANDTAWDLTRR
ncbi:restriction endonuclease [Cellulomonas iranensis]|uniref:Restriction endonuclease type IV Mrr domain-containing protein n=1 Tax=Cellulomonas iranensis TaxID=76862 RepID=A0ABU0GL29_9CELL|nr:restriction endonuclease [Cellulomonas iranensis]MDQ0426028.1 hypothetical protein [Cellulomonas iranensis]